GDRLRMTGEMPSVAVTDTRNEANGWSVAGQSSDLTAGDESVTADHLGWVPSVVDEEQNPIPGGTVAGTLAGGEGLSAPQTLGQADAENRMGSTELAADLNLEVPVDTEAGTYEGALSVSLFPVD
ncbi:MAG: alkaline phosphatase, partial [Yaniella sp.]|nr:alkaline phosphatase [Yaniella sp.]